MSPLPRQNGTATARTQLNVSIAPQDADAIRAEADRQGVTLARLVVQAVLGREPIAPPSRQELAQRVGELEARLEQAGL